MSRADERETARLLAAVLDGAEPADADLAATARVLRDVAAVARFDLSETDVEQALERARPAPVAPSARPRLRVAGALVGAAALVAAAILLVLPFVSGPVDVDVQARALAALGSRGQVLGVSEVVRPGPGARFPVSTRTGWIDPAGDRQRWTQTVGGKVVAETLVDHGRITRYDPVSGTAVVAASCAALASGCAESIDPVAFYRQALAASGPLRTHARTERGRRVYRITLPVERLADSTRIVQVATLDASTFLPLRIEWRQLEAGGRARTFATISVGSIMRVDADELSPDVLDLNLPPGTPTTQLAAPGRPVQLLGVERVTLAEARSLEPHPWWLGPRFRGSRASELAVVHYTGGTAVRIRYGRTTVWTYGRVVPPPLLGKRVPLKTLPVKGGVARFYAARSGALIGERSIKGGTVAVMTPGNEDAFTALMVVRPL
jgi:hypothetical protein